LYYHSAEELQIYKQYFIDNLDKGFIVSSQSLFTVSILFVCKDNRRLWFCVNYCKLNIFIYKDQYLLSLLDKTLAWISKAKVFTKLDICQTFHCIQMDSGSEDLTTFQICYSCYKYKVVPFELTNRLVTYQRYINNILFDYLNDFYTVYLDDILIYSDNKLKYKIYIYKVLKQLWKTEL
jgi:hypothetical protein